MNDIATVKVKELLDSETYKKGEMAIKLGISRPTLNKRLKESNWTKGEVEIIKHMK